MNYLPSSYGRGKATTTRLIYAVITIVLGILLWGPISTFLFPVVSTLAVPFWKVRDVILKGAVSDFTDSRARVLEASLETLKNENAMLRRESELIRPNEIRAQILSSLSVSPYDTIIIDKGSISGVPLGSEVISGENILLGVVVEVYKYRSKVKLLSAFGTDTEVAIQDGTRVMLSGAGNQNFATRLPSGLVVGVGQFMTTGSSKSVVAQIEKLDNDPGAAFQTVYARSPLNIHMLTDVYVRYLAE